MLWWHWLAALIAVALAGSIAVAAQGPGRARDVTAWAGVVGFYTVLAGMFGDWTRGALASGSRAAIGFGLLAALFAIGWIVALFKTLGAARRSAAGAADAGATH
ncbi:MAG: hypothetical protein OZ948_05500 [Deltaproteobacteria bacterium]|nr:hypothetical protein [Deltaproteobacteria bacterium]